MFIALKKVLGYHRFRDGWEVGTFVTQWLIMQLMDCYLQGIKSSLQSSLHSVINASFVAEIMWKTSSLEVQVNLNCSC
jgi:hypothetical protein